jgi:uroporphyrinogen-III synthase
MSEAMEKDPDLKGLRVLVTRPKPMGEILCQRIDNAKGKAIYFPTIDIFPPQDSTIFPYQLAKIDKQDWLIFISPQAVYATSHIIHLDWPNFPPHVKIAAVGGGTAKALKAADLRVDVHPTENWSSEGLLALPEFQNVAGMKIALMRGEGGREWLDQSLKIRGAIVSQIIVYRRVKPHIDTGPYKTMLHKSEIDCIVSTSGEGLYNLKELLKEAWSELQKVKLIVISQRMQQRAIELGFKEIMLAKNPSQGAIIDVLKTLIKKQ